MKPIIPKRFATAMLPFSLLCLLRKDVSDFVAASIKWPTSSSALAASRPVRAALKEDLVSARTAATTAYIYIYIYMVGWPNKWDLLLAEVLIQLG